MPPDERRFSSVRVKLGFIALRCPPFSTSSVSRRRRRAAALVAERTKFGGISWDLAPDGKRLLVLTPVESAEAPKQEHEVVFLENFFDYLRQRVPLVK